MADHSICLPNLSASLFQWLDNMYVLLTKLNNNAADFVAQDILDLQDARDDWNTARLEQQAEKGEIAGGRDAYNVARKELQLELSLSVHDVALQFPGEEDKAGVYYDESLLREKGSSATDTIEDPIDGNETAEVDLPSDVEANTSLNLQTNSSVISLVWWFAESPDEEPSELAVETGPNETIDKAASELGFSSTHTIQIGRAHV